MWTAILNLYNSQPQAVHLKTIFHILCCALLSRIKLLFRLCSQFSMYLIYSLITSWKCLIISYMSISFTTGKQDSLFIQSDKKIWGLYRSKWDTSLKHAKRLTENDPTTPHTAEDPSVLCKSPVLCLGRSFPWCESPQGLLHGPGLWHECCPVTFPQDGKKNKSGLHTDINFST